MTSTKVERNKDAPPAKTVLIKVQRKRSEGYAPIAAAYASRPKRETLYCLKPTLLLLNGSLMMGIIGMLCVGVGVDVVEV